MVYTYDTNHLYKLQNQYICVYILIYKFLWNWKTPNFKSKYDFNTLDIKWNLIKLYTTSINSCIQFLDLDGIIKPTFFSGLIDLDFEMETLLIGVLLRRQITLKRQICWISPNTTKLNVLRWN